MKPGYYPNMPMAEYLAAPAVSASLLKTIINECPRAACYQSWLNPRRPRFDNDATDRGSIAHSILLEGSTDCVAIINPADHPAEKTGAVPVGWTNKSIRAARDAARAAGKIPVLADDFGSIENMVSSAWEFIHSLRDAGRAERAIWQAFQPAGGESEATVIWNDGGTLCRCRPDRMSADRRLIIDYKTGGTSAEPDAWGRTQMIRMGYYVSAAFYRRGIKAQFGVEPEYVFLVQEQDAPYLCSLVGVDPHGYELGAAKIARGLSLWQACVASNRWPAYPALICYPEIPAWEDARWQEREAIEEARGIPFDYARLVGEPA